MHGCCYGGAPARGLRRGEALGAQHRGPVLGNQLPVASAGSQCSVSLAVFWFLRWFAELRHSACLLPLYCPYPCPNASSDAHRSPSHPAALITRWSSLTRIFCVILTISPYLLTIVTWPVLLTVIISLCTFSWISRLIPYVSTLVLLLPIFTL